MIFATAAWATPLLDTFGTWTLRARDELQLDGARPYRVSIAAMEQRRYTVSAQFGTLGREADDRGRPGVVEVVVGEPALDSSRFDTGSRGTPARQAASFVLEDVEAALARDLWLVTDTAFKDATQRLTQKRAALAALPTPWPADWTPAPAPTAVVEAAHAAIDPDALRRLVIEGSRAFRDHGLRSGRVDLVVWQGQYSLATSEGTRLALPESWSWLSAWCDRVRPDGVPLYDERSWLVATPAGLPGVEALRAAAADMGRGMAARAQAPIVSDYEGPVLFTGQAAGQLFAALLAEQLEGTPPEPRAGLTWEEAVRGGPRIGRKLLPDGWSVDDDPRAVPAGLPGGWVYDRQGVASRPVALVRDGVVKTLLMSRVPRKELSGSTGHARGEIQGEARARLSAWTVSPARSLGEGAFARAVQRSARDANVERLLVVRSLAKGRRGSLPRPQDAVWRAADGTETPALALSFQESSRRNLKDIVAASGVATTAYLAGWGRGASDNEGFGNPTVLTGPAQVLVEDLELVFAGSERQADAWPMPEL